MNLERIFIRRPSQPAQEALQTATVVAESGLLGDRYFGLHDEPGQNVTLIEAEEIEAFFGGQVPAGDYSVTGRNLLTRGVRLNELVGCEFMIGRLRFRGVELCQPCLGLGQSLQSETLTAPQAVRRWVNRAGLRADALTSGELAVGDVVLIRSI